MAEPPPHDRLQPSLLDRLTDDEPGKQQESRTKRVLSMPQLRRAVLRDLAWLLNTGNLGTSADLGECPSVENSVLNYGVPDLAGLTQTGVDLPDIERAIERAIRDFEPRILPGTLRVTSQSSEGAGMSVSFVIEGDLWAETVGERLFLKTEVDLETGQFEIVAQDR